MSPSGRSVVVIWSVVVLLGFSSMRLPVVGQSPVDADPRAVDYRLSFPAPQHRWLQVDVMFPRVDRDPIVFQMSNASPGRYAAHAFAKNVFDVEVFDGGDRPLMFARPTGHQWEVAGHDGTVHLRYRIFGDRVDGTYLGVDSTHAHMNMPATLMWARGLEERPIRLSLTQPEGESWEVATQLYPTGNPLAFTAPNLQYLMDSPTEFSDFEMRTFVVTDPALPTNQPTFRVVVHHTGTPDAVSRFATEIERIVRETVTVFGEFPAFETNSYTFIADYLPYASGDGMEHRNSTVLTSTGRLDRPGQRSALLGAVAHEFFHVWNVERIRPRSLEPFDFTAPNISSELWLAEGFTNYYGALLLRRAALADLQTTVGRFASTIDTVLHSPGRRLHTAVEMSQLAPFTDAAMTIDRTNWDNTFISYYTWGEAVGLGLDLTLRGRTGGLVSLDDYMRAMWRRFGKPGGSQPGLVDVPYTLDEAKDVLGEAAGDHAFADDFFARFIEGHEVVDYAELLASAGVILRPRSPGAAWLGDVSFGSSLQVSRPTPYGSPLHLAGIDLDDIVQALDGERVSSVAELVRILDTKRPGDTVAVEFLHRGRPVRSTVTLTEDPHIELVTVESTSATLTPEQRVFREAWLGSQQR